MALDGKVWVKKKHLVRYTFSVHSSQNDNMKDPPDAL